MKKILLVLACITLVGCNTDVPLYQAPSTVGLHTSLTNAQLAVLKSRANTVDGKDAIRKAKVIGLSLHDKLELLRKH